jgi:hypothetical protein
MSCDRAVSMHLLRGLGAAALLVAAVVFGGEQTWLLPLLLLGAVVLLRGCPMCWLVGLFDVIGRRRDGAAKSANP